MDSRTTSLNKREDNELIRAIGNGFPFALDVASDCVGRMASLILRRGGRLVVDATSRQGGIIVESNEIAATLAPLPERSPDETALFRRYCDAVNGGLTAAYGALEVNRTAYETLLAVENRLLAAIPTKSALCLFDFVARADRDARARVEDVAGGSIGRIAFNIFKSGGLLILQADGPTQGITIERRGHASIFLNPVPPDEEERVLMNAFASQALASCRMREEGTTPYDIGTLRELLDAEARLRLQGE